MALVVSFAFGVILTGFLNCRPFAKSWDPLLPGTCGSTLGSLLATSITNFVVDLIITLPMPMLWRLQKPTRRKIALTITFGLGINVCVVTILRIVIVVQLSIADLTYDLAKLAIVTDLEPLLGMIIACLPLFPPTFNKIFRGNRKPESRSVISSTIAKLRSRSTKKSEFRRFNDSYLLMDLEGNGTQNQITGPNGGSHSSLDDRTVSMGNEMEPQATIKVRHGWEVRLDKA